MTRVLSSDMTSSANSSAGGSSVGRGGRLPWLPAAARAATKADQGSIAHEIGARKAGEGFTSQSGERAHHETGETQEKFHDHGQKRCDRDEKGRMFAVMKSKSKKISKLIQSHLVLRFKA